MNNIQDSLQAIQQYNPKEHVYLRVVGEGDNQYLKAEKIGWFGRILMWFGCSNANMSKVARFVHNNINKLCTAGVIDLKDNENALGKLNFKLHKYSKRHPKKIEPLVEKISLVYTRTRFALLNPHGVNTSTSTYTLPTHHLAPISLSLRNPTATVPAATTSTITSHARILNALENSMGQQSLGFLDTWKNYQLNLQVRPNFSTVMSTMAVSLQNKLSLNASVLPVSTPLPTIAPIISSTAKLMTVPSQPCSLTGQEAVNEYEKVADSIAKVGTYDLYNGRKKGIGYSNTEFDQAIEALNKGKELIKESSKDQNVLKALLSSMSITMIDYLTQFSMKHTHPGLREHKLYIDIFEIRTAVKFNPSSVFNSVLNCLSIDQFKQLIKASYKHKCVNVFYNLAMHVSLIKNPQDKSILMAELSNYPDFEKTVLYDFSFVTDPTEAYVNKELAFYYFQDLLKNKTLVDRDAKIVRFLKHVQWHIQDHCIPTSPLEDQSYLDQLLPTFGSEILTFYCKSARHGKQFIESLLFKKVVKSAVDCDHLFKIFVSSHHILSSVQNKFCRTLLNETPHSDDRYINDLVAQKNHVELCKYIKITLPHAKSSLEDPTYIDALTPESINLIGAALVNIIDVDNWHAFYILRKKIFKNEALTIELFNTCNTLSPTYVHFEKFKIPEFLKDYDYYTRPLKLSASAAVKQYQAARVYIAPVVNSCISKGGLKNISNTLIQTKIECAAQALDIVKELIQESARDPKVIKALMAEMTPDEISAFANLSSTNCVPSNTPELLKDVFDLNAGTRLKPSKHFKNVVEHMSVDQLKNLIAFVCAEENGDAYYNIASLVKSKTSLSELTNTRFFKKLILKKWGKPLAKNNQEIYIDKEFAFHYLQDLLNDSTNSKRKDLLMDLLRDVQFDTNGVFSTSPLEDQTFLDRLTDDHIKELTELSMEVCWEPEQFFESLLISNYTKNVNNISVIFYTIDRHKKAYADRKNFITFYYNKFPNYDHDYFRGSHSIDLLKILLETVEFPKKIDDPVYIDNLSNFDLFFLASTIVTILPPDEWIQLYLIKKISNDPLLTQGFFKSYIDRHNDNARDFRRFVDSVISPTIALLHSFLLSKKRQIYVDPATQTYSFL